MSGESTATIPTARGWTLSPRDRRVLRYAMGATLCVAIALGFGWPLSFLTPVLSLGFLAAPARLGLRAGIGFVATIAVACLAGLLLTYYLLPYPLVYLPFAGLLLFHLFHAKSGGASPLLITWLLIALLVLPLMGLQSAQLSLFVAAGIVTGAMVTMLMVWLIWAMFPAPPQPADDPAAPAAPAPPPPTAAARFRSAVLSMIVVSPRWSCSTPCSGRVDC
jgi:hypothetical protein